MRDILRESLPDSSIDVEPMILKMICKQLTDVTTDNDKFVAAMYKACAFLVSSKGDNYYISQKVCLSFGFLG